MFYSNRLQNLNNLTHLNLTDNNIKEISALSNLSQLDTLKLRGNLIEDYTPTQSYYNNITTKDFSTTNADEFVFRISNVSATGGIGTIYITKGQYLPQRVYTTVELYSADGVLQKKKKSYMSVSSSSTEMLLNMPSGYTCDTDGSYIVLSLYERSDEQQLLTRITIKPTFFDLSGFN